MSLINQMLTDLDKRKTGSRGGGDAVPEPIPVAGAAFSNRRYLFLGAGAALVVVVALLIFWNRDAVVVAEKPDNAIPTASIEKDRAGEPDPAVATSAEVSQSGLEETPVVAENAYSRIVAEETSVPTLDQVPATEEPEPKAMPLPAEDAADKSDSEITSAPKPEANVEQMNQQKQYPPPIEPVLDADSEPVAPYKKSVKRVATKRESGFEKAQRYLSQGRLAEAESTLREVIDRSGKDHKARELLAGLLIRGGRSEEALALLREGAALAPQHPGFALLQARILMQRGDRLQAIGLLERVAESGSGNKQVITLLAVLYQQQKRHERALELYRMLIAREPGLASNWVGAAISLEGLGNPDEALSAYQRAVSLPNLAQALRAYATDRIEKLGRNR
jgi:tetratricopeptide (TPR) repeat protein